MIEQLAISVRGACCYAGLSRTSYREPPSLDVASQELSARIVELAHLRRRFGYRRIHELLAHEGHEVNHKRVRRDAHRKAAFRNGLGTARPSAEAQGTDA